MMHDLKSAMADSMGGSSHEEKPKKEIKHIEVRKGKSGGHIITHHHTHPSHAPEEHVTSTDDQMASHMLANAGNNPPAEATPDTEAAENAPTTGAAPMAAGVPAAGGM